MASTAETSTNALNKTLSASQLEILMKATGSDDKNAYQTSYDDLWKAFPKGYLTEEEFVGKFHEAEMYGTDTKFSPAKQLFHLIDRNKSGTVDLFEYYLAFLLIGNSDTSMMLKFLFTLFDVNKNGLLTQDEVVNVLDTFFTLRARHNDAEKKSDHSLEEIKSDISQAFGEKTQITEKEFYDICKKSSLVNDFGMVMHTSTMVGMMVGDCGLQ